MNADRVFVSGAAGVIGREVVPRLLARGAHIWAADLKPRPAEIPGTVLYRQGDLNQLTAAEVAEFQPTIFINLAATFERSDESYAFWDDNFSHNVRLSHHLMTLLKDVPSLRRVVFASSYLIYDPALYQSTTPRTEAVPLRETDPVRPRNLTGAAKSAHESELAFLSEHCQSRFTSVSARIFRGYGKGSRDIISRWVRMALAGERLVVYRPEGIFDYVYAGDSAEGLVRLAAESSVTGVVNLASGYGTRVGDVVNIIRAEVPGVTADEVSSDIPYEASCANVDRLRTNLCWVPGTSLSDAIRAIVEYERDRPAAPHAATGNVLVSSAARKIPLIRSVIDATRRLAPNIAVLAGDADAGAAARHVADGFVLMPRTDDLALPSIISECERQGVRFVIPTRDGELTFWSRHAQHLADRGIEVVVSELPAIEVCRDKIRFSRHVAALGLAAVPCLDEAKGDGRFVVKERFGSGSRGIGVNLSASEAQEHAAHLIDPIYQPFVSGREISVDAWLDRRHCVKGLVLRWRDRVEGGESVETTTFRDAAIEASCRRLSESLPLRGPIVIQLLQDNAGDLHFLELNPRFGGASTAGIAAGLDVWYWSLCESFGTPIDELPFRRIEGEVHQIRVPTDLHVHGSRIRP